MPSSGSGCGSAVDLTALGRRRGFFIEVRSIPGPAGSGENKYIYQMPGCFASTEPPVLNRSSHVLARPGEPPDPRPRRSGGSPNTPRSPLLRGGPAPGCACVHRPVPQAGISPYSIRAEAHVKAGVGLARGRSTPGGRGRCAAGVRHRAGPPAARVGGRRTSRSAPWPGRALVWPSRPRNAVSGPGPLRRESRARRQAHWV